MPAELQPPTQASTSESESESESESASTTEPTTESTPECFPYETDRDGTSLPASRARGVLASSDGDVSATAADGAVGSTACPDCGGETINGAGLFACQECRWTGSLR